MYNCAPQIGRVLQAFEDAHTADHFAGVLCVDNRSTDDTLQAAQTALSRTVVRERTLVRNNGNYGLGGSHKVAIRFAIDNGFTHLVVLHGDDQGSITDLLSHIQAGAHRQLDCLLGARFMPGSTLVGYSALRTVTNRAFNSIFSVVAKQRLYDLGSGLNLYRTRIFEDGFHLLFADDLTFNYYLILATSRLGMAQRFFPLTWREDDQVSNAKLFRQGRRMLVILSAMTFNAAAFLKAEHREAPRAQYDFTVVEQSLAPQGQPLG